MYIRGRSRTGWRPLRIEMSFAHITRGSPLGSAVVRGGEKRSPVETSLRRRFERESPGQRAVFGPLILPDRSPSTGLCGGITTTFTDAHDTRPERGRGRRSHPVRGTAIRRPGRHVDRHRAHAVAYGTHVHVVRHDRADLSPQGDRPRARQDRARRGRGRAPPARRATAPVRRASASPRRPR